MAFSGGPNDAILRIESITWNRDSHELFDYESRHVYGRKYLLRRPARVFRSSLEVSVVAEGDEFPQTGDFLLSVKARDGKFFIHPADRQVCPPLYNVQPKKLWLIIKHLQRSSFPLGENDVVKLGRFKLKVKQIVADTNSTAPVDFKLDDVEIDPTNLTLEESQNKQCRICLLEGGEAHDPLVRACQCKGSIMYVHLECLRHWVNGRLNLADDPSRSCCFIRQIQCELCKATFPTSVTANDVKLPVVKVPNVQPPFIVLENVAGPHNRGVHLCSLSVKKECKLGRGHESDVRIPDVSISRCHAVIKFVDGSFYLEDHQSKFGTLVALRRATMVDRPDKLSVQVGRTVLRFSVEEGKLDKDVVEMVDGAESPSHDSANPGERKNSAQAPAAGEFSQQGWGDTLAGEGAVVMSHPPTSGNRGDVSRFISASSQNGASPMVDYQHNAPAMSDDIGRMAQIVRRCFLGEAYNEPQMANSGVVLRPSATSPPGVTSTQPPQQQVRTPPFRMHFANQLWFAPGSYSPQAEAPQNMTEGLVSDPAASTIQEDGSINQQNDLLERNYLVNVLASQLSLPQLSRLRHQLLLPPQQENMNDEPGNVLEEQQRTQGVPSTFDGLQGRLLAWPANFEEEVAEPQNPNPLEDPQQNADWSRDL